MAHDELAPPPPPDSTPPPPPSGPAAPMGGSSASPALSGDIRKDNPIALAALVVSLLGLLLAILIIGGLVGIIAIVMAVVGLKRSKNTNSGRGMAIGAIALSLLSIVASAGALTLLVTTLQSGDFDLEALISNSPDSADFPPEEDILSIVCSEDGLALATISVDNPTESRQIYTITVLWDSTTGEELTETFDSDVLAPGAQAEFRIFQRSSTAIAESCEIFSVERVVSLFG